MLLTTATTVLFLAACGGGAGDSPSEVEPAPSDADTARAIELYQGEACAMCHGETAEGVEEMGPALRDLAPYWTADRLVVYLEDPEAFRRANPDFEDRREERFGMEMPAFDHLPADQRERIARWLMTR